MPDGLIIGKPFKTLALGQVSSRLNGSAIGSEIDTEMLSEMVRVFKSRRDADPVIIDWQHATSPFSGGSPAPPESGNALGLIVDVELREDGLYAIPAYNERGLEVVRNAGGVLWSSPEFIAGDVYTRDGGDKIGNAQLLAITLTPRPAQSNNKISRVTLSEELAEMDNIEELSNEALRDMVRELQDVIKNMKADSEAKLTEEKPEDEAEKMAESKDDDAEKMAESKKDEEDEAKKMAESKDEKKSYNMSENYNVMLSEVTALREQVSKLTADKEAVEMREAVSTLLREGRITPNEQSTANDAWKVKGTHPAFWQMFSERPANSSVPFNQVGHGASGEEISIKTLNAKIEELQSEKGITYSEALNQFRTNNADYYNQAYGVK